MPDIQATKRSKVSKLLKNPTYLPDSGIVKQLTASLLKLSNSDLGNLGIIFACKQSPPATTIAGAIDCLNALARSLHAAGDPASRDEVGILISAASVLAKHELIRIDEVLAKG